MIIFSLDRYSPRKWSNSIIGNLQVATRHVVPIVYISHIEYKMIDAEKYTEKVFFFSSIITTEIKRFSSLFE